MHELAQFAGVLAAACILAAWLADVGPPWIP